MTVDAAMWRNLARQITGLGEPKPQGDDEFAADLARAAAFRERHGRAPDPRSKNADEARLGAWVRAQQGAERRGALCGQRRAMLIEALGPDWTDAR